MTAAPLEITGLSVRYGSGMPALDGVSFSVGAGEVVGIVGDGGSGKSTLIDATVGLLPLRASVTGQIEIFGQQFDKISQRARQRLRGTSVGTIVSGGRARLNPMARVGTQIEAVLTDHGWSGTDARGRTLDLLSEVGIPDVKRRINAYPHELSGGMAQRIVIAIAIACRPKLIIADEPTRGLDVTIQADILELFGRLVTEIGAAAVLATRDLGIVAERCSRVIVLESGRIIEDRPVRDFFREPHTVYGRGLLEAERAVLGDESSRQLAAIAS